MTESKPREFWIKPAYKPEDEDRISFCKVPRNDFEHVIEFSAYEKLQSEIRADNADFVKIGKELQAEREKVDSLIAGLQLLYPEIDQNARNFINQLIKKHGG